MGGLEGGNKRYRVKTAAELTTSRNENGAMYWIIRVEVVELDTDNHNEKVVFSFVPEPWIRISATDARHPEHLQKVCFLPGQDRFVVAGIQTLQVWSLPTNENDDFNLAFIWSRPKARSDLEKRDENDTDTDRELAETDPVGEYYHFIRHPTIFIDKNTGEAEAHIKLTIGSGTDIVSIPRGNSGDFHTEFVNCARSIHLLAASYAYSAQESKKSSTNSDQSSHTFEEHAEAIARFTRRHINRVLSLKCFCPSPLTGENAPDQTKESQETDQDVSSQAISPPQKLLFSLRPKSSSRPQNPPLTEFDKRNGIFPPLYFFMVQRDEDTRLDGTFTILKLLLDEDEMKDANHIFIEGLLNTDGHEWTPHPSLALNPINCVINTRNERLLKVLIDYCIKNAHEHHPGYLTPVTQCLGKLSWFYPDIMSDMFMRASYILARNPKYVATHAIMTNQSLSNFISFVNINWRRLGSSNVNNYQNPFFTVQSQLPWYRHLSLNPTLDPVWRVVEFVTLALLIVVRVLFSYNVPFAWSLRRKTSFPQRQETVTQSTTEDRLRKIYVSPFQFRP
ncbi:hypothetical protein BGX34_006369, partial [Mortierella sp. NVP85]